MASWNESPSPSELAAVRDAADWLVTLQQADGSLGVTPALPSPGWTTPYALLLWNALGGFEVARRRALTWLLELKGRTLPPETIRSQVIGHDPTLVGWPWIKDTHSWLEPTALAVLALDREGQKDHPRAIEGTLLIRDRAIPQGGWNYGNKTVFGHPLCPQPGPTGLALLALAIRERRPREVGLARDYLFKTLPSLRAPISLGWGVLGLRAWDECPALADSWLAQAYTRHSGRPDAAVGLGLLLQAAGKKSPLLPRQPGKLAATDPRR
jgi:hypothetical protein